jgi:hypothetical protein
MLNSAKGKEYGCTIFFLMKISHNLNQRNENFQKTNSTQ